MGYGLHLDFLQPVDLAKDTVTHSLDGFAQFLHTVHHGGIAVKLPVAICALIGLWIIGKCIEYTLIPD